MTPPPPSTRTRRSNAGTRSTGPLAAAAAVVPDRVVSGDNNKSSTKDKPEVKKEATAASTATKTKMTETKRSKIKKEEQKPEEKETTPKMPSSSECPVFLRKTYHMIDTCDPTIATWSPDGQTFVVKNTSIFASTIIPQFFKHSKWSSFVRQLNFYGFRKIKYCDTIRIDPILEKETANYWRFKHDKFVQGRPDLLVEIKRHNAANASEGAVGGTTAATAGSNAAANKTNANPTASVVVDHTVKIEVRELKERIAKMSKNIDDLTSLVHTMNVKEDRSGDQGVEVGNKRKKTMLDYDDHTIDMVVEEVVDEVMSTENMSFTPGNIFPSSSSSSMAGALPDAVSSMLPDTVPSSSARQTSAGSDVTFVDDLFNAFNEDGLLDLTEEVDDVAALPQQQQQKPQAQATSTPSRPPTPPTEENQASNQSANEDGASSSSSSSNDNRPDPKLMKELSDALTLLPREMQEMLVNRLIATIFSTESLKSHIDAVFSTEASSAAAFAAAASASTVVVENDDASSAAMDCNSSGAGGGGKTTMTTRRQAAARQSEEDQEQQQQKTVVVAASPDDKPEIALQLDAATLNALLAQYTDAMKQASATKKDSAGKAGAKTLPVIAVH